MCSVKIQMTSVTSINYILSLTFVECEAGCLRCQAAEDGEHTVCLECPRPMVVFDNICVRQCPIGHFNQSSICRSEYIIKGGYVYKHYKSNYQK